MPEFKTKPIQAQCYKAVEERKIPEEYKEGLKIPQGIATASQNKNFYDIPKPSSLARNK